MIIRNTLWAFPYLAVMGLIWGYLADASSGALAGLLIAAATSVWVGKAITISSETSNESGQTMSAKNFSGGAQRKGGVSPLGAKFL
jgi:hypothetical protein